MGIILEINNLVIRNFKDKDLDILFKYRNNSDCAKYQRWEDTSIEYLEKFIEIEKDKRMKAEKLQLAIALKDSDELVGDLFIAFKENVITLGYTISFEHQRKGYAYETLQNFINYIFNNYECYEIVCMVHQNNEPSKNLLNKLNFKNEGYVEVVDSIIYSLQK